MKPDMIFGDISDLIIKSNKVSIVRAALEVGNIELIHQIYVEAMEGGSEAALQVRKYYNDWTGEEAIAKKRIQILCWGICSNIMKTIKKRKKLMLDNHETIVENTISKTFISPTYILLGYKLTEDEITWINTVSPVLKADEISTNIKVGTYVEIVKGSFLGTIGQVKRVSKRDVIIDTFVLGRHVPVSVSLDCIEQTGEQNATQD
jgi:transcription antitermination factor NusG